MPCLGKCNLKWDPQNMLRKLGKSKTLDTSNLSSVTKQGWEVMLHVKKMTADLLIWQCSFICNFQNEFPLPIKLFRGARLIQFYSSGDWVTCVGAKVVCRYVPWGVWTFNGHRDSHMEDQLTKADTFLPFWCLKCTVSLYCGSLALINS